MESSAESLFALTAADLMSRAVVTVPAGTPLRDAAAMLGRAGVHGAPVTDDGGRCVGVLSLTDIARWAARPADPPTELPRACSFQDTRREPGGREEVLCRLPGGSCPLQRPRQGPGGRAVIACAAPQDLCTDWQVVEAESLPADDVRHYMTTEPVTAGPAAPIAALARLMTDSHVRRVVVLDGELRPVGVVSVTDLLAAFAGAGESWQSSRPDGGGPES